MSGIYAWIRSDTSAETTKRAHSRLTVQVNVGSKFTNKKAIQLSVHKTKHGFEAIVNGKVIKDIIE